VSKATLVTPGKTQHSPKRRAGHQPSIRLLCRSPTERAAACPTRRRAAGTARQSCREQECELETTSQQTSLTDSDNHLGLRTGAGHGGKKNHKLCSAPEVWRPMGQGWAGSVSLGRRGKDPLPLRAGAGHTAVPALPSSGRRSSEWHLGATARDGRGTSP